MLYKYCAVPQCANSSKHTPGKLFIPVPRSEHRRIQWLELASWDWRSSGEAPRTKLHFCEDHFDLPNDVINYIEYHVMGSRVVLRHGCWPTKFACQLGRNGPILETLSELECTHSTATTSMPDLPANQPGSNTGNVATAVWGSPVEVEVVYVKQEPEWAEWEDGFEGGSVGSGVRQDGAGCSQESRFEEHFRCKLEPRDVAPEGGGGASETGAPRESETACESRQAEESLSELPATPDHRATPRKPYTCDTCTQQFKKLSHLRDHMKTHANEMPFKCETCNKHFKLHDSLEVHQCTHSSEKPHTCKTCNKGFAKLTTLQSHERTHTGETPYSCDMCDKAFSLSHSLKAHCSKSHGVKLNDLKSLKSNDKGCAVPLCESNSRDTPEKLFIHIPRSGDGWAEWLSFARKDPASVTKRSTLYFCEDHFDMPNDMLNYTQYRIMGSVARMRLRPGCVPTKCRPVSGGATTTQADSCGLDNEEFIKVKVETEGSLYAGHEVRGDLVLGPVGVQGARGAPGGPGGSLRGAPRGPGVDDLTVDVKPEPVWENSECGEEFTGDMCVAVKTEPAGEREGQGEEGREAIQQTPTTKPPRVKASYTCSICGKHFKRVSPYKEHLRVHTGERPYACDICNKRFKQLNAMKAHLRIHTGERSFSCETCHRTFARLKGLQNHEFTHTGEKPYSCDTCKLQFAQLSYLRLHHLRIHTLEKPYACERCSKAFSTAKSLNKHIQRHGKHLCKTCGRNFKKLCGLVTHRRLWHSKKQKERGKTLGSHRKTARNK